MSVNDVLSGVAKWWEHVACCTTPGASTAISVLREVAHRVKTEKLHLQHYFFQMELNHEKGTEIDQTGPNVQKMKKRSKSPKNT